MLGTVRCSVRMVGIIGIIGEDDLLSLSVDVIIVSFLDRNLFTIFCKVLASMLTIRKYLKSFVMRVMDDDDDDKYIY